MTAAQPKASAKDDSFKRDLAESEVLWNFEKFLVGRDGRVIGRFAPDLTVEDPLLLELSSWLI